MPRTATEPGTYVRRRDHTLALVLGFVVVSVVVHLAAFSGLRTYAEQHQREVALNKPVELVMVEVEAPKPPPPPPLEEKPPEPPKPKAKPPPIKVATVKEAPPPPNNDAPPPPNEEAQETPSKPVPLVVGISMSSTSSSGSFAAPVGNTSYGKVEDTAQDPSQVKAYKAPKYVPVYQVDRQPEAIGDFQIPYPPEARRAGIEGLVVLSLKIDEQGNVVEVKALSGPGYGLEEAAVTAMKRAKFKPATHNGEPVGTTINYRYNFLLD